METWIIYVIAPIAIALVSWILGKNGRRIDETSKLVALLQEEITRLTAKVEKLEAKVEIKEHESERKSGIIPVSYTHLTRDNPGSFPLQDAFAQVPRVNQVIRVQRSKGR